MAPVSRWPKPHSSTSTLEASTPETYLTVGADDLLRHWPTSRPPARWSSQTMHAHAAGNLIAAGGALDLIGPSGCINGRH